MKILPVVGLTLLLCSSLLAAQTGDQSPSQLTVIQITPPINPCPVEMRVRQGMGSQFLRAKDGQRKSVPASRLHVNLSTPNSSTDNTARITSATFTVHGLNGKGRMLLVGAGLERSAEVTRTMNVSFSPDDDKSFWSELVLPGFAATTMVDLETVTYADGATLKLNGYEGCHAAPDPIMLIAAIDAVAAALYPVPAAAVGHAWCDTVALRRP